MSQKTSQPLRAAGSLRRYASMVSFNRILSPPNKKLPASDCSRGGQCSRFHSGFFVAPALTRPTGSPRRSRAHASHGVRRARSQPMADALCGRRPGYSSRSQRLYYWYYITIKGPRCRGFPANYAARGHSSVYIHSDIQNFWQGPEWSLLFLREFTIMQTSTSPESPSFLPIAVFPSSDYPRGNYVSRRNLHVSECTADPGFYPPERHRISRFQDDRISAAGGSTCLSPQPASTRTS